MRALIAAGFLLSFGAIPAAAQSAGMRADSAWEAGQLELARRLYEGELAANPDNSHAVFRLAQLSPDPHLALRLYQRYTVLEPDDAWGWMALGDELARLGRTREALAMYDRAGKLRPLEPDVAIGRARILTLRATRAPALEPSVGYSRDSDGNRTSRLGLRADWEVGEGTRLGVSGSAASIGDGVTSHRIQEGSLRLSHGSGGRSRFTVDAGGVRLERGLAGNTWLTAVGEARLRWHAPGRAHGMLLDLRAQRLPLGTTPLLIENRGIRNEARAIAELPVGPLKLRGGGRVGSITALSESNTRWAVDGALVLPLGWQGELSFQYHRLHYDRPSNVGYFAPRRVESIEGGSYAELAGQGVSLAFDLGAGAQRLQEFGAGTGPWRLALRGWAYVAVPFAPGRELRLELEGYQAPFAPEGVTTSEHWSYFAVSSGVRWSFH
jgi:hypothetical protein